MEFMTGYYRQKEDSTALLLQQYVCRGVPVCLGCICGGENREAGMAAGLFTGRLLEDVRGLDLSRVVKKQAKFMKRTEKQVYKYWESHGASADFWAAGILCIGERFLLFSGGAVKIALCNTGFGRPALCEIRGEGETDRQLWFRRGSMETGIGILLASESFYGNIPRENLQSCLAVKDIHDSGQTRKRVLELGRAAEGRGGRGMAALLLEVRGEGSLPVVRNCYAKD